MVFRIYWTKVVAIHSLVLSELMNGTL